MDSKNNNNNGHLKYGDLGTPVGIILGIYGIGVSYLLAIDVSLLIHTIMLSLLIFAILITFIILQRKANTIMSQNYDELNEKYIHLDKKMDLISKNRDGLITMHRRDIQEIQNQKHKIYVLSSQLSFLLRVWEKDQKPDKESIISELKLEQIEVESNEKNTNSQDH